MATFNFRKTDLNELLYSSQNKSYFVGFITVLFVIVFVIFGVLPAYSSVINQREKNELRDETITKLENKLNLYRTFDELVEQNEDVINYLQNIFPTNNAQEVIIEKLFVIAGQKNVAVINVGFTQDRVKKPLSQEIYPGISQNVDYGIVNVSLDGNRVALLDFIKEIENSRAIFNIQSSSLTQKDQAEIVANTVFDGDSQLNISIQYFYLKQAGGAQTSIPSTNSAAQ